MAEMSNLIPASLVKPDRRLHTRHRLKSIIYLELGEGNGGLITYISPGGLAVQAAMAVVDDNLPRMRFQLPRTKNRLELQGRIAWKSDSKKMAGVQFLDLDDATRAQIDQWISLQLCSSENQAKNENREKDVSQKRNTIHLERGEQADLRGSNGMKGTQSAPNNGSGLSSAATDLHRRSGRPSEFSNSRVSPSDRFGEDLLEQSSDDVKSTQDNADAKKSTRSARVRMKRYLVNDRARILLHDFVSIEAEKICTQLADADLSPCVHSEEELLQRLRQYEELSEILVAIMTTGCYWGEPNHSAIWTKLLERVSNAIGPHKQLQQPADLRAYPALLLLYAGGVAAVANHKYSTLVALLLEPRLRGPDGDAQVIQRLNSAAVINPDFAGCLAGHVKTNAPLSLHLHKLLREPLKEFIPLDADYDDAFDRFEYLTALVWIDDNPKSTNLGWVPADAPLGRFASANSSCSPGETFIEKISAEISHHGNDWPPLRAGLLGGLLPRLRSSKKRIDAAVAYLSFLK